MRTLIQGEDHSGEHCDMYCFCTTPVQHTRFSSTDEDTMNKNCLQDEDFYSWETWCASTHTLLYFPLYAFSLAMNFLGHSLGFTVTATMLKIQGESSRPAAAMASVAKHSGSTAVIGGTMGGKRGKKTSAAAGKRSIASVAIENVTARSSRPKYRGMVGTLCVISKEEGVRALYSGLAAGLQRQFAFGAIRIGMYDTVKQGYINLFQANGLVSQNNIGLRILAGITTGGAAVLFAQPTDVVKVRMQAQGGKGPRRYTGCVNAYKTIAAKEGVRGLWKGTLPNVTRNSIVNATELVSYDLIKESIIRHNLLSDNMPCHFTSAFGAGFCTTVIASPVDVVKTRFMNSGSGVYKGALHCASSMFREGGVQAFYKGFMPSFMRLGSWNIVMFVTFEQLKRFMSQLTSDRQPIDAESISKAVNSARQPKRYM